MGNCFETCLPEHKGNVPIFDVHSISNEQVNVTYQANELPRCEEDDSDGFCTRLLFKKSCKGKSLLKIVNDLFINSRSSYNRLRDSSLNSINFSNNAHNIQLQCLDVRALHQANSSPESSVDLEWEHETIPFSISQEAVCSSWNVLPDDVSTCRSNSSVHTAPVCQVNSEWSRGSSVNSLEWDSIRNSTCTSPNDLDPDTQLLLNEIERLTNRALLETGHIISDS